MPGAVWRTRRGVVSARHWRTVLGETCAALGLPRLRPHDLRRTFATLAEGRVGRYRTALAGGWDGTGTMDRHYISPRADLAAAKLQRMEDHPAWSPLDGPSVAAPPQESLVP